MTILGTSLLGNGLTIWDARLLEDYIELFVVLQTPLQGTEGELTLTANDHLAQLLALIHLEKSSHQLLCILGIDSLDSTRVLRIRILDEIEAPLSTLSIQGIARLHVLHLHGTTDITGIQLIYRYTVGTSAGINLSDTFLGTTVRIGQVITTLDRTTHHLEVANLADMWLQTSLEEVNTLRTIGIWSNFLTTGIMQLRHLAYERNNVTQELHQAVNAHRLTSANAEYREDAAGYQTLADTLAEFILCQAFTLEEFLHQALVVFGSSLNECCMKFHCLVHFLLRNILDDRSTAFWFPGIFFHQ